ncbi:hypothetical protein QBC33DRAFT_480070 [Phialemonium atrogriseum]|uniref:Peptidase S8/S53 domain-containing protein n=1 Tax=Phialemonium atrogriseum TaxID=1093897 RepID=A0AAJ0BSI5_9PEZI|nr:uncharacterized protein QBC33DRAFT_480070 [Phialemonium atrogriseum]KAK1763247.1 hypothetical protein QBC33DRAFT_480070 [Phialemonium atrogriseum]
MEAVGTSIVVGTAILSLLQTGSMLFYRGLPAHESFKSDTSRRRSTSEADREPIDDETRSGDGPEDPESSAEESDESDVDSSTSSDYGALRRYRAFAKFEARTFNHNVASKGRHNSQGPDLDEAYLKPAEELKTCLEQQFGTNLSSTIENVVVTGTSVRLDPSRKRLSKTVRALTAINTAMEGDNAAARKENANVAISQTSDYHFDRDAEGRIRRSLVDLHGHLQRLASECSHKAMLQMNGFNEARKTTAGTGEGQFEVLLSPCPDSESSQWQETCCAVKRRAETPADDSDSDETICSMIQLGQEFGGVLHITFNQRHFFPDNLEQHELSFPSANPSITLRDLLDKHAFPHVGGDNSRIYSWSDRYLLALNLARSLFYLFDGPWGSCSWKADNIFFLSSHGSPGSGVVHNRYRPYIRCPLEIADMDKLQGPKNNKGFKQLHYPMWLALAQVLMEVHIGRSLVPEGNDSKPVGNADLRRFLLQLAESELKDSKNDAYREAVKACLNFGIKLLRAKGLTRQKEAQKLIRKVIISNLEKNYEMWSLTPPERPDLHFSLGEQAEQDQQLNAPDTPAASPDIATTTGAGREPCSPPGVFQNSPMQTIQRVVAGSFARLPPGVSILTLFDDNDSTEGSLIPSCRKFFDRIDLFKEQYIDPLREIHKSTKHAKIKIAVLDSGVDFKNDLVIRGALSKKRIRAGWGPTGTAKKDFLDSYGHGTHVTRLLLRTAPLAEIYVAKISEDKHLDESKVQDMVDAITWAAETVDAHIITMSFGMKKEVPVVAEAISHALHRGKLIFAAAANEGGLQPRAYPASHPGVICIHASDGYGTPATFNPNPEVVGDNFSTVGTGIESEWNGQAVFKSGTSFATPVAAGIAANILEFAHTRLRKPDGPEFLSSYRGMRALLACMAPERQKYHFISPWRVFPELTMDDPAEAGKEWEKVCEELRSFILTGVVPRAWRYDVGIQ